MPNSYVKFEVYLPARYREKGEKKWTHTSANEMLALAKDLTKKLNGCTYSNPIDGPPFQGMWKKSKTEFEVDEIYLFFVLVEETPQKLKRAFSYFEKWKKRIEKKFCQDIVVVTWHRICVMGEL